MDELNLLSENMRGLSGNEDNGLEAQVGTCGVSTLESGARGRGARSSGRGRRQTGLLLLPASRGSAGSSHRQASVCAPVGDPLVQMAEAASRETLDHYFEAAKLRTVRRRRRA